MAIVMSRARYVFTNEVACSHERERERERWDQTARLLLLIALALSEGAFLTLSLALTPCDAAGTTHCGTFAVGWKGGAPAQSAPLIDTINTVKNLLWFALLAVRKIANVECERARRHPPAGCEGECHPRPAQAASCRLKVKSELFLLIAAASFDTFHGSSRKSRGIDKSLTPRVSQV